MNGKALIVFALIAVFVFAVGLMPQDAQAAPITFTTDTTITTDMFVGLGGSWAVNLGVTLTISSGVFITVSDSAITNSGTIINHGTITTRNSFITNHNGADIINEGTIGNGDSSNVINDGTIDNQGNFGCGGCIMDNNGILNNYGAIGLNSGGIINHGTINNNGTIDNGQGGIDNYGTINNNGTVDDSQDGTINNYGMINNYGIIDVTEDGVINNTGTINNFCTGQIFGNPIVGNQIIDKCISGYSLALFEGDSPSDGTITHGQPVRAVAYTEDTSVGKVTFKWIDPLGTVVREITMPVASSVEDTFAPNLSGTWTIEAHFENGATLVKTIGVSFMVLPESPIGAITVIGSSLAVLGVFMKVGRHNRG